MGSIIFQRKVHISNGHYGSHCLSALFSLDSWKTSPLPLRCATSDFEEARWCLFNCWEFFSFFTRWSNFESSCAGKPFWWFVGLLWDQMRRCMLGQRSFLNFFGWQKKFPCYIKTMSLKILNKSNTTLKKSRKRTYWSWNVRKTLPESQKMCRNFYFRGHLSTLVAKNTTKSGHFRSKNNAQILLKQVKNFQKFHSRTFLTPKIVKYVTLKWPKLKKIRTKT